MFLALDIGNTNVSLGCFRKEELVFEARLKTDVGRTLDEYIAILDPLFVRKFGTSYKFSACIISSVVPPITWAFTELSRELLNLEALVVGPGIKTGISLKVNEPIAVGADRVVNAVALKTLYGSPGVVVDLGTATTFDVIGPEGNFEGGIICPGLKGSLDSLSSGTAKLPRIELVWPKSVVGKNTIAAMQSGSMLGYACMIDGLIEQIVSECGPLPYVVATGGMGKLIIKHTKRVTRYDPNLTLCGLRILAELNGKQ